MLRKLIWFAITSGLAKKLYQSLRAQQVARKAARSGSRMPPRAGSPRSPTDVNSRPR